MTDTGCIQATIDEEMREIGPVPSGCGENRAILHSRPRRWTRQSLRARLCLARFSLAAPSAQVVLTGPRLRASRPVRPGCAAGFRRPFARLAGGRLPAFAGAGGGDAAPRRRPPWTAALCVARRGARRRRHRLGVQRRRHAGPRSRAARRVPPSPGVARRRRGPRSRCARRRARPALRARPGGRARRGDDHDVVQGAGQSRRHGARARGGTRSSDRRRPAVHLRHRPGAGGGGCRAGRAAGTEGRGVAARRGAAARPRAGRRLRRTRAAGVGRRVGGPGRSGGGAGRRGRLPGRGCEGGVLPAPDRSRRDVAAAAHRARVPGLPPTWHSRVACWPTFWPWRALDRPGRHGYRHWSR